MNNGLILTRFVCIIAVLFMLVGCVPSNIHYTPQGANVVRSVSINTGYDGTLRWNVRTTNVRVGN